MYSYIDILLSPDVVRHGEITSSINLDRPVTSQQFLTNPENKILFESGLSLRRETHGKLTLFKGLKGRDSQRKISKCVL